MVLNKIYFVQSDERVTGISNYQQNLIKNLDKNKLSVIFIKPIKFKLLNYLLNLFNLDLKTFTKNYPIFWKLPKDGIIHFTNQQQAVSLLWNKRNSIITVHDIIPYATNTYNSLFEKIIYYFCIKSIKKATHIIADSTHTKQDLINYLKIRESKISVIHLGVDMNYFKTLKIKKEKYTILYVGSEAPRKNLNVLLEAFALLKKKLPEAKLIKVGLSQCKNAREQLIKKCQDLNIQNSVVFKDYVEDLVQEYNNAKLFVFPSIYEGFGLPILEAMACSVPVISSNKTSLPEIGGDAVRYFDGYDINDLAEKMYGVLTKNELKNDLIKKGLNRVKKFSWNHSVRRVIEVYKKLINNNYV